MMKTYYLEKYLIFYCLYLIKLHKTFTKLITLEKHMLGVLDKHNPR